MQPRIDFNQKNASGAMKAMLGLETYIRHSGLEESLVHLIKTRVSQINHCAYCIDMHTKDARASGEAEQRLYALSAWRETPFYSERERAALEWAEALTMIAENGVPDELYERVRAHFSEEDLISLTLAAVAINGWNRIPSPSAPSREAISPLKQRRPRRDDCRGTAALPCQTP
jgi:AhpD family alkylhydroperoxidase